VTPPYIICPIHALLYYWQRRLKASITLQKKRVKYPSQGPGDGDNRPVDLFFQKYILIEMIKIIQIYMLMEEKS